MSAESKQAKLKDCKIRALRLQKGDKVKTPQGEGVISAVGVTFGNMIRYRVGTAYWADWQLTKRGKR